MDDDIAVLHASFKARPGSDQIATPFALHMLRWWLWDRRPLRICEIGAGIGTLSAMVSEYLVLHPESRAVAVEDDPWYQRQWRENLTLYPPPVLYDKLPVYEFFDFLILDGPQMPPEGWTGLEIGAIIFIEGNRREQRR